MKKFVFVLLALAVTFLIAACSDETTGGEGNTNENSSNDASVSSDVSDLFDPANYVSDKDKSEWMIGVVTKDNTAAWFQRMEIGVNEFGEEMGINVIQRGPANADPASQVQVIDDLIAQGVDAIAVVPIDPGAIEASLENALSQGIVVVTHEASNQVNTLYDVEAFTSEDFGSTIMDALAREMGEEGKYAMMVGYTTSTTHMEYASAQKDRQLEAYPNMELINGGQVPSAESEESVSTSYERAKEILNVHPDLKGFTGVASTDSPGIANALEELGLADKVAVVGVGTPNEFSPYINSGTINRLLLWDPKDAGYAMVTVAAKILAGEEISEGMDLGVTGYENVQIFEGANKTIIGNAPLDISADNIDDFDF
ncbi:autoinducer 2 ABC transporter substrate-binding protein [Halalkalibacter lacteus]|uniref:autoinducer 2 ABC transporter substrate-binding protein n=1 Tax=Halalkalibacter lacteus TaxID=3090663 RepID=UPI002FC64A38